MSGLVVQAVVVHIVETNYVVKTSSPLIVVVAVGSSTASESDVVAQLLLMSPRWPPWGPPGH